MKLIQWYILISTLTAGGHLKAQSTLKPAQEKAILNLLRVYESSVNTLVPELSAASEKTVMGVADFQKTLFVNDKPWIYNHVAVANLRLDSATTLRMQKAFLTPQDFLKLCAGVFKSKFSYKLGLSQATINEQPTTDPAPKGGVETRLAQVFVGVHMQGNNGTLQIKQADSLRIDIEFVVTSQRNVIPVRILRIIKAKGGFNPPEDPGNPTENTLSAKAKVDSLMMIIGSLTNAKDTLAVQYRVYQRLLPRLVAGEGKVHLRLSNDSTERKLFATDFAQVDSLRRRKYQFDKALLAYVTLKQAEPGKPAQAIIDYFFGTTFTGNTIQYLKNYRVSEDSTLPRFIQSGWWIDEIWLKESTPAKKSQPKHAAPIK